MTGLPVSVLLVDDHAVVREGYRRLLEQDAGIRVIGEAADGNEAYRLFRELLPDVVVLDIALPGISGLETMRRMLAVSPQARVLFFSMYEDAIYPKKALADGARGYVTKASAPDVLVTAVHAIAGGRTYLSEDASRQLALPALSPEEQAVKSLTLREFEVLRLLAHGRTLGEIADTLFLNQKTVANHQSMIKQKLGCENSAQLVLLALRTGVLGPRGNGGGAPAGL